MALAAPTAFGWGCDGHQVIAILAENMLPSPVVQRINQILTTNPGPELSRRYCDVAGMSPMADAATWADDYREVDRKTGPLHFVDIPIGLRQRPNLADYCKEGCVVDAIQSNLEQLKTAKTDAERAMSLRFLIHFVGDVHQPLHASTNGDRGGNCVPVTYFTLRATVNGPREDATPNLHNVWDSTILHTLMRRKDYTLESFADALHKTYARRIRRWAAIQDPKAWAIESFERGRTVTYGALPTRIRTEDRPEVGTCSEADHLSTRMLALDERIDDVYLDAAFPTIEVQLAKAGARLAKLLEDAFK